jgi:hypothetical protein
VVKLLADLNLLLAMGFEIFKDGRIDAGTALTRHVDQYVWKDEGCYSVEVRKKKSLLGCEVGRAFVKLLELPK